MTFPALSDLQMKWMDFFLEDGELGGKIICPNKKCAAKIGNYDWAGVCCGCKEWVVPVLHILIYFALRLFTDSFFRGSVFIAQRSMKSFDPAQVVFNPCVNLLSNCQEITSALWG